MAEKIGNKVVSKLVSKQSSFVALVDFLKNTEVGNKKKKVKAEKK